MLQNKMQRFVNALLAAVAFLGTAGGIYGLRSNIYFWQFAASLVAAIAALLFIWLNIGPRPTEPRARAFHIARWASAIFLLFAATVFFLASLRDKPLAGPTPASAPTAVGTPTSSLPPARVAPPVAQPPANPSATSTPFANPTSDPGQEPAPSREPSVANTEAPGETPRRSGPVRVRYAKDGEEYYPATLNEYRRLAGQWCSGGPYGGTIVISIKDGQLYFKDNKSDAKPSKVYVSKFVDNEIFYIVYEGGGGNFFVEASGSYLTLDLRYMNEGDAAKNGYAYGYSPC